MVDDMVSRGAEATDEELDKIVEYLAANFSRPKIGVNQATAKELASALGLSAEDAEALVRYREKNGNFKEWDDLKKVRNWGGVSFDPHLGYIFVNTQDLGNFNKMVKAENGTSYVRVGPDDRSLGADSSLFLNPEKHWPCQQPPWGELTAVNANTGDIAWKVPLGSFEDLDAMGVPKTGRRNVGGSITTAGGLVFIGATEDHKFHAFDSRTGKQLWETQLVDEARSVPITFEARNGKQYVAVMAGGGNNGATGPGRVYVFSLP